MGDFGNFDSTATNAAVNTAAETKETAGTETMDWNTPIFFEKPMDFITLEPGVYDFTVDEFERGEYAGNKEKNLPPCHVAKYKLVVETEKGKAVVNESFFLNKKSMWRVSAFLQCIGFAKEGETKAVEWGQAVGLSGRARIEPREYDGKTFNNVKKYIQPEG